MPFQLEQIVPWGRSFREYQQMFELSNDDLDQRILGCGDGPASFNAEMYHTGRDVVSCDPIYQFSKEEIRQRIKETTPQIVQYARQNLQEFRWTDEIPDPDALASHRLAAMEHFLSDFEDGLKIGRYVEAELPTLPFNNAEFPLCVCSHLLFLYSEQLDFEFHVQAIRELLRVAREVRIFPLLELGSRPSRHLPDVLQQMKRDGFRGSVESVPYEFQRRGNQMMRIRK